MAPLPIELHPVAIDEAGEARGWYEVRSARASEVFMLELDQAIEKISANPDRWNEYVHGTRRYLMKKFPYIVVYRELPEKIQIVAIAHGKRRPGYWKRRMK